MKGRGKKRNRKLIPAELAVSRFEFDAANLQHLGARAINQFFVEALYMDQPRFAENPAEDSRSATHLMIAESRDRGVWTVAIIETSASVWRPITAYPSNEGEVTFWRRSRKS